MLEIVNPGFGNQYGRTCAPIYQIAPLVDNDTWVAQSNKVHADKPGSGSRHPGVVLDGPMTGGVTSAECVTRRVATVNRPPPQNPSPNNKPPIPNHRATAHATSRRHRRQLRRLRHRTPPARRLEEKTVERLTALLDTIARQIDSCDDCDRAGQLVYGPAFTPCPKHPNFRQPHIAAMRAKRNALRQDLAA